MENRIQEEDRLTKKFEGHIVSMKEYPDVIGRIDRLALENGQVIVMINGRRYSCDYDYFEAETTILA